MRHAWMGVGLCAILLLPTAAAWPAELVSAPEGVTLRDSLLLAGKLDARVDGGAFGAPRVDRLVFDAPATVLMCPDQRGEPQSATNCAGGDEMGGARLYVLAGGVVARTEPGAELVLQAPASAAALGGPNVTLNGIAVGAALYAGGDVVITAQTLTLALRPLGDEPSLEVRGDLGFRTYNGSAYTLYVSNVTSARVEAHGGFVGGEAPDVSLTRAGLADAEAGIDVVSLYELLRAVQPAERADRRADLAEAFGPFQFVPALLDGAAAAQANLTLNGDARTQFTFLRLSDGEFSHDGAVWTGSGNATYLVDDVVLAPRLGAAVRFPVVLPLVFVLAAIAARLLTTRQGIPKARRLAGQLVRWGGLVLLLFLAAAALAPLLGFSPLLDARVLGLRSRVQLALLVVGMVASAWLAVGLPAESLTRSLFAWRERPKALVIPVLVGLALAMLFLLLATPVLLSFVARLVRL